MRATNDNSAPANAGALTFISMFSGIEAASCAWPQWHAICFSEIEKFPSALLAYHYPNVPNVGDMSAHDWSQYRGKADIVCGGPPCQAFSIAGLRESLNDARGNLSLVYMKALHAIKPRNAIIENVPGWLNTPDNAFGCFLAGIVGADDALLPPEGSKWPNAGMVAGPWARAAWRVLDAQYFGLAQRRKRVIVVADFGNGADPAAVLFERESVRRNSPPSRETGQGVAGAAKGGAGGCGEYAPEIARCDATREGSSQDYESTTMVAVVVTGPISHALKAEGADASEGGTGRGTPIITTSNAAFDLVQITSKTNRSRVEGDLPAHTMTKASNMHIAQTVALRGREGGATAELGGDVATALRASSGGGDKPHVLAFDTYNQDTAEVSHTLRRGSGNGDAIPAVLTSAVRRLTPVECERLMGFPDNYTRIPWRGKPADQCPDGPRYKALGNSWAVPLFTWLGRRIDKHMPRTAANDNTLPAKDRHAA